MISIKALLTKIVQRLNSVDTELSNFQNDLDTLINDFTPIQSAFDFIGDVRTAENSSAVSIASSTGTAVTSLTLTKGVWVIIGKCRFPANTTGIRRLNISTTSGAASIQVSANATTSSSTDIQVVRILNLTSNATYYLNAWQDSGGALSCPAGQGTLDAVRII